MRKGIGDIAGDNHDIRPVRARSSVPYSAADYPGTKSPQQHGHSEATERNWGHYRPCRPTGNNSCMKWA